MTRYLRACIVCAKPFAGPGPRCPDHALPNRSGTYTRTAKQVVANATHCHLCGLPFTDPTDPPVADHLVPRSLGGSDDIGNLRPAHRSCNGRRGNRTKAELNWRDHHHHPGGG